MEGNRPEAKKSKSLNSEIKIWSPQRMRVASFVEDKRFDMFIGVVIFANSIVLVLETDQRADCEDPNSDECNKQMLVYSLVGNSFMVIYIIELVLKFFAYRLSFFGSAWNQFDFVIVIVSILSEVLGGMIPAISVARVFRAARLAKVFRVLMVYKELYLIIFGFASAMRAIIWASILIFLLLTIWSIFAVELLNPVNRELAERGDYQGCDRCPRAFESVMASNLTFLQTTISGDSWGVYAIPIIEEAPLTVLLFIGVWATVVLGFGNLILAVIVDCAADARQDDLAYQERIKLLGEEAAMQQFLKLCGELDSDGSGCLSYDEFLEAYNNSAELSQMLKVLNIGPAELPTLFAIMDEDHSGDIGYLEFANNIHKMKSSESYLTFTFIKHEIRQVKELTETRLDNMQKDISNLADSIRGMGSNNMPSNGFSENGQENNSPIKQAMSTRTEGVDAIVDALFQDEVKLKLDEIVASTTLLVSKTLAPPSDLQLVPGQLLSLPQSHVSVLDHSSGPTSGSVLIQRQQSAGQTGMRRMSSARQLPQAPPDFFGGTCSSCTLLPQASKSERCRQEKYMSASVQPGT